MRYCSTHDGGAQCLCKALKHQLLQCADVDERKNMLKRRNTEHCTNLNALLSCHWAVLSYNTVHESCACAQRRRAVQQLQLEGVIASAAHCDVTSKHEVEQLVSFAVQQVTGYG